MSEIKLDNLIEKFVKYRLLNTRMILERDFRANYYAKKYIKCIKKIFSFGENGKKEFARLLNHENMDIRVAAASILLDYKTDESMEVLKAASKSKDFIGFCASECILRWQEGTWELNKF